MQLDILSAVTLCLSVSFIFSEIFYKLKYPRVIGQILAGIFLGLPFIKPIFSEEILMDIEFLSSLGIIFLLLLVGLELNLEKLRRLEKDTLVIALFSVAIPFTLGFILIKAMGYSYITAFIVGAAFSLTAEGTKLKVLFDIRALNSRLGIIMLGAGILDDVFEVIFLSIVLVLSHKSIIGILWLPVKILLFVILVVLFYRIFPYFLRGVQKERSRVALFSFVLLFAMLVAVISQKLDLGPIIGAFIAGIIIHLSEHRKYEYKEIVKEINAMTFALIIPFFFINIGLKFQLFSLTHNLWLTFMIVFVACVGKLLGALLATPFTDLTLQQTHLIGWGMNSRGAVELVIAGFALSNSLISSELYSSIVLMALLTTISFPFILKVIVSKDRSILK